MTGGIFILIAALLLILIHKINDKPLQAHFANYSGWLMQLGVSSGYATESSFQAGGQAGLIWFQDNLRYSGYNTWWLGITGEYSRYFGNDALEGRFRAGLDGGYRFIGFDLAYQGAFTGDGYRNGVVAGTYLPLRDVRQGPSSTVLLPVLYYRCGILSDREVIHEAGVSLHFVFRLTPIRLPTSEGGNAVWF